MKARTGLGGQPRPLICLPYVGLVLLLLGSAIVVFRDGAPFERIAPALVGSGFILFAAFSGMAIYRAIATFGWGRVSRGRAELLLGCAASPSFYSNLAVLLPESQMISKSIYFTLIADRRGITVIGGGQEKGRVLLLLEWSRVCEAIEPVVVPEEFRRSNGLLIPVHTKDGSNTLQPIVLGAGFGGLFPKRWRELETIAVRLNEMRATCLEDSLE